MVRDLTHGNPMKLIIKFCLPLMLGQFFQQLYNMVDSIIVGRFAGTAELSAVGSTGSISFLVLGFVSGFTTGVAIPVSQAFGEGDYKKVRSIFINCIYITGAATVILTGLTCIFVKPLLKLMNTPDDIFSMAYDYISTIFLGLVATLFYNLFASVMRALGDSRTPLLLLIFSSFLNIGLDLLFVLEFGKGCKGVAIATIIAQLCSALLALFIIIKKFDILKLTREDLSFSPELCGKILYIGLPMALQMSVTAVGSIMLQSAVNTLGSNVIAAVTVGGKTQLFIIMPAESIGIAMATFCGQNLGARRMDRVKKGVINAVMLELIYSLFAMVVAHFASGTLSQLFVTPDQTEVISLVESFLGVCCMFYPVLAVLFTMRNSIQGLGYSIPAMLAGVFELAARGVMGFVIIPKFGYIAVCFANPAAWIAADILLFPVFFIVYFKLKKRIGGENETDYERKNFKNQRPA